MQLQKLMFPGEKKKQTNRRFLPVIKYVVIEFRVCVVVEIRFLELFHRGRTPKNLIAPGQLAKIPCFDLIKFGNGWRIPTA